MEVPGAVFVVVKDGKVLLQKGYGTTEAKTGKPVDPEKTVFRIASVSKVFAATAVMQLAEQGKIDLRQDVQQYMGGVKLRNDTGSPLTMEHLLTHTTGFDVVDPPPGDVVTADLSAVTPLKDYVIKTMSAVVRQPGEAYKYDNFASMLQGYIVEQVSGMPFHQYVCDHIFKPLGMENSQFVMTPDMKANLAVGHTATGEKLPPYNTVPTDMPQGSMMTTGSDMAKFMLAQLNEGKLGEARILRGSTVQDMQSVHTAIHPKVPTMTYGFELPYGRASEPYVISKGGDMPGFTSWMWLIPEHKVGGFIVYNKNSGLRTELFNAFMDRYFPSDRKPVYLNPDKEQLARFEGTYRDLRIAYLTARVKVKDDALVYEDLMGRHKLKQIDRLLFEDEQGRPVAFQEDKNGTIRFLSSATNPSAWWEKLPEPDQFKDVGPNHPYAEYIEGLQQLEVIRGGREDAFRPDEPLTRAEFAVWLARWLGAAPSAERPPFADIAEHPEAGMLKTAIDVGFVTGTDKGLFEPDRPIARQEAASMVSRLAGLIGHPAKQAKLAEGSSPWAADAVANVVGSGFYGPDVKPSPDGTVDYRPKQAMTRQEGAALLYRLATASLLLTGSEPPGTKPD